MKKNLIAILSLLSLNAFAANESCRLAIHDLDKLIGENAQLNDQVLAKLEKKNITLISENELIPGDFHIPGLIAVYDKTPNIPMHEYKFKTKTRVGLVPCVAFPLCSPVVVDREVKDIVGIKYKHDYKINLITDTKPEAILYERFTHSFNEEPVSWNPSLNYDGSAEQEDLALSIADEMPKCTKLKKALKKD